MMDLLHPPLVMAVLCMVAMGLLAVPSPPITGRRLVWGLVLGGIGILYFLGSLVYGFAKYKLSDGGGI